MTHRLPIFFTLGDCASIHCINIVANRLKGVWTRFFPLTRKVQDLIHTEKIIGKVARVWCDFSIKFPLDKIPSTSRMKDPSLGAGASLDVGIYSLMWGMLLLEPALAPAAPKAKVVADGVLRDGFDISTTTLLTFEGNEGQGILTCSLMARTGPVFATIEGEKGNISISGASAGTPEKIVVKLDGEEEEKVFGGEKKLGFGFYWEADSVALDIAAGRTESSTMPLVETLRSMKLLDEVRRQIGLKYPQDK
jgi:predicted dehydrogenase